jgi:hypothetical protein
MAIVRRIPEAAIIEYHGNPNGTAWSYQHYFLDINNNATTNGSIQLYQNTPVPFHVLWGTCTSTYQPHDLTMYAGAKTGENYRYFWLNKSDAWNVTIMNPGASAQNITATWYTWDLDGGSKVVSSTTTSVSASASLGIGISAATYDGYYSLVLSCSTTSQLWTITDSHLYGSSYVWGHKPIPSYSNIATSANGVRIIGASMMYSNRSAVTSLEGSIYAIQPGDGVCWKHWIGDITNISSAQGSVEAKASTGLYGFLKPSDTGIIEMQSNIVVNEGQIVDVGWPIDYSHEYIVAHATMQDDSGKNGFWTYGFSIEFRTTDVTRELAVTTMDADLQNRVMARIGSVEQFYENPLHIGGVLRSIGQALRGVAGFTVRNGPKFINAAVKYGPSVIEGANFLAGLLA